MASNYDININIDIESANLGELEKEFGRLNEEIKKIPRNSAAFNTAASNIKKVSGEVEKTNRQLQKLDVGQLVGDFAKVGAAIGAATLVFQQFGEEGDASNEALQKTLERTQAILGLVAIAEGVVSAAKLASIAATRAQAVAQNLANAAVQSGIISLQGLKAALISTGIGALVVALGAVIANFGAIQDFFTGGKEAQRKKSLQLQDQLISTLNANYEKQVQVLNQMERAGEDEIEILGKRNDLSLEYFDIFNAEGKKRLALLQEEIDAEEEGTIKYFKAVENKINAEKDLNAVLESTFELQGEAIDDLIDLKTKEAKKAVQIADAQGKDTFQLEKNYLELRLTELRKFSKTYKDEIEQLELQLTLIEEKERKKRQDAANTAAKERRDRIKGELTEIAGIISQDPFKAVQALSDEQERALGILQKYSGGSKDITKIIKELTKEGLTPLANQFKELTDEANFEEFQKLVKKYYGKQTVDIITGSTNAFATFRSNFLDIPSFTEQLIDEGDPEKSQERLNKLFTNLTNEIETYQTAAQNEVTKLVNSGLIDYEQAEEILAQIDEQFYQKLQGLNAQYTTSTNSLITQSFEQASLASQESLNAASQTLAKLENTYVDYTNFLQFVNRDLAREAIAAQKKVVEAQRKTIIDQIAQVQAQKAAGVITEEAAALQLEALNNQLFQNEMARQKLLNDEREFGLKEALEVYNQLDQAGRAYLDLLQSQIDLETAGFDAQIKAREDKLKKDLENDQLTADQRTAIEAKAAKDITAIEKQKAQAIADLQIKQAKLKYKLDVAAIIINQSLAIVKAFAELGPIAGFIAAGLIAASTGFQLATARNARDTAIGSAESAASGFSSGGLAAGGNDSRQQFADGGYVSGPGTSRSDSIPARLSNGEFVVNAASTSRFLPLLKQINSVPRQMADGGLASNGPDITDVLLRIEKRLATPPKAYVVTSEIRDGLNTEEYLQRRATLT